MMTVAFVLIFEVIIQNTVEMSFELLPSKKVSQSLDSYPGES